MLFSLHCFLSWQLVFAYVHEHVEINGKCLVCDCYLSLKNTKQKYEHLFNSTHLTLNKP